MSEVGGEKEREVLKPYLDYFGYSSFYLHEQRP